MAKTKTRWICQQCGFQANGFLGRCTECGSWGSLVEELVGEAAGAAAQTVLSRSHASFGKTGRSQESERAPAMRLSEIKASDSQRMATGLAGVDEVLGGGLVPGSVVLLAGDPGIGKSTLLLQVARHLSKGSTLLYVAGEESAHQVRLRAERLGVSSNNILVDAGQNVVSIAQTMMSSDTRVTIVDSITSVFNP